MTPLTCDRPTEEPAMVSWPFRLRWQRVGLRSAHVVKEMTFVYLLAGGFVLEKKGHLCGGDRQGEEDYTARVSRHDLRLRAIPPVLVALEVPLLVALLLFHHLEAELMRLVLQDAPGALGATGRRRGGGHILTSAATVLIVGIPGATAGARHVLGLSIAGGKRTVGTPSTGRKLVPPVTSRSDGSGGRKRRVLGCRICGVGSRRAGSSQSISNAGRHAGSVRSAAVSRRWRTL
jgi:hypothetical protein